MSGDQESEHLENSTQNQLTEKGLLQDPPPTVSPNLFHGQSTVRSLVRLFIFLAIVFELAPALVDAAAQLIFRSLRIADQPSILLFLEVGNFVFVLGVSALMAFLESRRLGEYGLPAREMFRTNFCLGALFGLLEVSLLVGVIAAFGGYSFGNLALHGAEMLRWGFFYIVLFLFVGLYEEFLFRGYAQFTLGGGIGFWPSAVLLSAGFGYIHLGNRGENWIGAASVALVGLLFAFTLQRTGSLWYAVGLHASFDWGETFLFSVPNSGEVLRGHLSNALLIGPRWLTGGSAGPEGSVFCFLTMGLQFLVVVWLFPRKTKTEEPLKK